MTTKDEALKQALEKAYLAGFNISGEGYNGEYPFSDHGAHPEQDSGWLVARKEAIYKIIHELAQPEQEPCGWQFYQDGKWHNGSETNNHREHTEAAGIPTRNVYPEPQPAPAVVAQLDDMAPLTEEEGFDGDGLSDCVRVNPKYRHMFERRPAPVVQLIDKSQWWYKELESFWGSSAHVVSLDTRRAAKIALEHAFPAPAVQTAPSQYGSPELQALILASAIEKAAPQAPAVQPLKSERIFEMIPSAYGGDVYIGYSKGDFFKFARAIEAAHGIGVDK